MTDIQYVTGAVHDDYGPVASFVGITERGKKWIRDWSGFDHAMTGINEVPLTVSCMEDDGLTVACLTR